jgi:poly-gamma-glutamate capsule biosynthesis protein CapA/YwtB (metallophosphatase superfamily)
MNNYVITFVGDTSFCESYHIQLNGEDLIKSKGRAYSLQRVMPILIASDLVVANLETPLTLRVSSPLEGHKKFIHWSDPVESPKVLKQHNISVVSLANNHTLDFGAEALLETFDSLDKNKIKWFGAGPTLANAQSPFRKKITIGDTTVPIAIIGGFEYRSRYKHRHNFYANEFSPGVNPLGVKRICNQIERLKAKTPQPLVIIYPHWGENYEWQTSKQTLIARTLVEAGADLIMGHGAHMLGGLEQIGTAWIMYSLGNFVFNSPGGYGRRNAPPYSLIARLNLTAENATISLKINLYPILTDNQQTSFQSRPVNEQEISDVAQLLRNQSSLIPAQIFEWKNDHLGYFFEIPEIPVCQSKP